MELFSSAFICASSAPAPSDSVTTMAAVPITTPSMVSSVRSLRRFRFCRLSSRMSVHLIVFKRLDVP